MPTPENKTKELIKRRLADEFNTLMYRFAPVQNGMGSPTLDVLYCVNGLWFWIEAKAPGKEPTPRQDLTIAAIRAAGAVYEAYEVGRVLLTQKRVGPHVWLYQATIRR
jgi:hypothetical protein